jgi:TolB-like protein/DNA-binding winged helix-turn-helix (wHTH) protein/tetratricopeptide (TPR) repeat protein
MRDQKKTRRFRTGLYEINVELRELFREGRIVPVQDQPFRVLAMLLEQPGALVSREELRSKLWSSDTYVGFDEGLNTAIRKLRVAFGDSAENPRFIETVPRRGYRFIAPLTELPGENSSPDPAGVGHQRSELPDIQEIPNDEGGRARFGRDLQRPSRISRRTFGWAIAGFTALAMVLLFRLIPKIRSVPEPARGQRAMLAVLPFQNLTNDPEQEYFSDGLTEETITDLGQLSPAQLGVIARTSAMAYKHTNKTIAQIGHELGVDFVLEGSVRRENGRARISAQLIRVADQTHLWAENYDAETSNDFIGVQNEIGRAISEQVRTEIAPQYQRVVASSRTANPEAYELYLRGRFFWNQRTPTSVGKSIEVLKQAIKIDPSFAQAYAALADAYNISNIVGLYSSMDSLPEAKKAALRAIELDPSLAEAHAALGMALSHYDFDFSGAKREFLQAIELNPNSAYAHLFYSNCYLLPMGRSAEAIAENKKAIELDPLSLPINNFLGMTYLYAGDYVAAEKQFRSTIAMDPNFPLSHAYLSGLLEITNRYPEAIDESEKAMELSSAKPENAHERIGKLRAEYKRGGKRAYWLERTALDEALMKNSSSGVKPAMMALDAAMAGEKETALEWLNKSYEAREGEELTLIAVDPFFNDLRGEPQFSALLERIGLPTDVGRH